MSTLIVVQGYSGDQARIEHFLPQWTHHELPVLLLSPIDAPVHIAHPQVTCRTAGPNDYNGELSVERYKQQIAAIADYEADWYMLNESDSFCLTPSVPEYLYGDPEVVRANYANPWDWILMHDDPEPMRTLMTHDTAMQAPWWFSRQALLRMIEVADAAWDGCPPYAKFIDWWFHHAPHLAGLRHESYGFGGVTWPITGAEGAAAIKHCILGGAVMVHGVKDEVALAGVLKAYEEKV